MRSDEHNLEEEKGGELVSRDHLLRINPKTRQGHFTVAGQRVKAEKPEPGNRPEPEAEKEK